MQSGGEGLPTALTGIQANGHEEEHMRALKGMLLSLAIVGSAIEAGMTLSADERTRGGDELVRRKRAEQ